MPANVTPEYERAERRFREADSDDERLDALRQMLRTLPKHKGTEKMQADIKRRISQLRKAAAKRGPSRGPDLFHVPKGGAGQVVLVGPPNVGKSLLVATTTNAPVKVADYPYATPLPVPGMWPYEDVQIELVDTPPLTADHVPSGLMGTIRSADIVCLVVDGAAPDALEQAEMVWDLLATRGLVLRSVPRTELDPADPAQRSALLVANKADAASPEGLAALRELYAGKLEVRAVSAETGEGLAALRDRLWELLAVLRVYTKQPGQPPDRDKPFTLPIGSTVDDLAGEIHRELLEKMRFARVWGDGRYSGQHVRRNEVLRDKDIVEIHE
jgi:ribosome-interacting GTPase 1